MTKQSHVSERLFEERRAAIGWLASTWSVYVGAIVVLGQAIHVMWSGGPPPLVAAGVVFTVVVLLVAVGVWGWRARAGVTADRIRDLADEHGISRWGMSTLVTARAAERIGRSPVLAAWANRTLIILVNLLAVVMAALLIWAVGRQ